MRRGRTLLFVFLIVLIALVVGIFIIRQFTAAPVPEQPVGIEVFVAGTTIAQGGEISEASLTTITIPQDKVVSSMYTRDEMLSLTGKIARFPLDQGVVITEAMVSDGSANLSVPGPEWASIIPSGMTAITIPADRLSLTAYAVADGAHVNINACFLVVDIDPGFQSKLPNSTAVLTDTGFPAAGALQNLTLGVGAPGTPQGRLELDPSLQQPYYLIPSEPQRPRMMCQLLLQNITVMRVGDFPLDSTAGLTAPAPLPTDPQAAPAAPIAPDVVTLLVSPQDSVSLSYMILTDAELTLTLRNPTDETVQATQASTLEFLLSQYNIPVPAKLPYSLEPNILRFGNLTNGSFLPAQNEPPVAVPVQQ